MPLRLLKYGLSRDYPVNGDIPATPDLRKSYDVVIIGGGGHGLACAHYLSKYHGITSVAVLEKGYLAGGNTARNTTTPTHDDKVRFRPSRQRADPLCSPHPLTQSKSYSLAAKSDDIPSHSH